MPPASNECREAHRATPPVGRFAPTPSGPLHVGSLVAALGSWLDARARGGRWLLRIEDLDAPRTVPGAADAILADLERLGLLWDDGVMVQSRRGEAYRAAFERLKAAGLVYGCACSRREIADSSLQRARDGGLRYPGTCRNGLAEGRQALAWRLRTAPGEVCFDDALQGHVCEDIARDVGDFVLLRGDGVWTYQLAVVVDDAEQGVSEVVRGADLLDSTPRQIYLQRLLGCPQPAYLHLPVVTNAAGEKLSKQTLAAPVLASAPADALAAAFAFLGHPLPGDLCRAPVAEQLAWGRVHWSRDRLPRLRGQPLEHPG